MSQEYDLEEIVRKGIESMDAKFGAQVKSLRDEVTELAQKSGGLRSMPGAHSAVGFGSTLATKMQADPSLQAWREGNRLASRVSFDFDLKAAMQSKAVITNNGDEQAAFERSPGIVPLASRRRWLWEYFAVANTTAPGVEYLQETGSVRVAGIQSSEGTEKDESDFTFDLKLASVETFAHYTALSRQVYADSPVLANFLQARLMEGVWRKMEQQMINGTGTSPEFSGLTDSGNHVVYSGPSSTFTPLDTVRDAMSVLQSGDYQPNLTILNPLDFSAMELERDNEGAFVWANPATAAAPMLWGTMVHLSNDMQQGKFVVMDTSAAQVWIRQNAQMLLSDSHNGNFTKNVLVALCEARAAFGVLRPQAVIYGDLVS